MLVTHFYSDPHYGHSNIIKYASRPFADAREMEATLIQRYNDTVSPDQTCLWLGDCSMRMDPAKFTQILDRLNGHKILVRGNHDRSPGAMAQAGFDLVLEQATMHIGGRTCIICHYPYADVKHHKGHDARYQDRRPKRVKGQILIHGHTHSHKKREGNAIHVGVDAWDYRPVTMDQVRELVQQV